VWGASAAAWPLIRHDLGLSYAEIGLVLAIPGLVGNALEPVLGVLADTPLRRRLLLAGGVAFSLSAALTSAATGFWPLLVAFAVGNPASTAFVSFAQAWLMDLDPRRRERMMAWWTFAGSVGVVAAPLLLAAAVWAGAGWRAVSAALAVAGIGLTLAARRLELPIPRGADGLAAGLRGAVAALRRGAVVRWLALLEASDLMLDVLHGFLALYLVDGTGLRPVQAGLALAVWTGAGLVGDALLVPLLARVRGVAYLRVSAAGVALAYPSFLVVPGLGAKLGLLAVLGLLSSGWYAIPKAGLYASLPGRSGTAIAVGSVGGFVGALVPLGLGFSAEHAGITPTMWLLMLGPVVLLGLLPRRAQIDTNS
jgi:FSR family fosmidomycin resistance protein-like MFS transporter